MSKVNIALGNTYKDRITGFTGVATGHVHYLTGCSQVLLQPSVGSDGNPRDSQWYDEQRLEQTTAKRIVLDNGETPGFDKAAPKHQ